MPARYILAVLGSIGMAIIYGLKVNLSVAMVAMLNNTALKMIASESEHHPVHNSTVLDVFNKTLLSNVTKDGYEICKSPEDSGAVTEVRLFLLRC